MITRKVNSKASVQKKSSNDYPFSPVQPVLSEYLATSTSSQTVINLTFSVDQSLVSQFFLFVDGKKLTFGSSNDYTFTAIDANNFSSQVTMTQAIASNLNIQAYKLGLKKESEFGQDNRIVTINNTLALNVLMPTLQRFTSGSGTYNLTYGFIVTSANATAGATYTNNSVTFTVSSTISGATVLYATGSGAPASSGILTKASGTGDATIQFSTFSAPKWLRVKMVGGGGGGAGSADQANNNGGSGTNGNSSTFGSSLLTAGGGLGGGSSVATGAAGGTGTVNSPAVASIIANGGYGEASQLTTGATRGASGGNSALGGGGSGGGENAVGVAGVANTGGGGGSGAYSNGTSAITGAGGGAGAYIEAQINAPSATYSYSVAASVSGGSAGATTGRTGGGGASGVIVVEEYYR